MFDSISRDSVLNPRACFPSLAVSMAVHALLAGMVLTIPLLVFEKIPQQEKLIALFALPGTLQSVVPQPPPAKARRAPAVPSEETGTEYHTTITVKEMTTPARIPTVLPPPDSDHPVFRAGAALAGLSKELTGAYGPLIAWNGPDISPDHAVFPPAEIPAPPVPKAPYRIGTLDSSKLIFRVPPVYPPLAVKMHLSGIVRLEALIDEEGNVADVTVLEGNPVLRDAAVEAVRQWKFSPTIQNGEPIPIVATIRLTFSLRW